MSVDLLVLLWLTARELNRLAKESDSTNQDQPPDNPDSSMNTHAENPFSTHDCQNGETKKKQRKKKSRRNCKKFIPKNITT